MEVLNFCELVEKNALRIRTLSKNNVYEIVYIGRKIKFYPEKNMVFRM